MKIRILYGYRGKRTDEQYLAPGVHDLETGLAEYLLEAGQAALIEPPIEPVAEPASEPESEPEAQPVKRTRRKRTVKQRD
jgi:hypothetical protein